MSVWLFVYLPTLAVMLLIFWPLAAAGAVAFVGYGTWYVVSEVARSGIRGTFATPPCAVCGHPNKPGHGCHLDAIAVRNGSEMRTGRYGRYRKQLWKPVVRDHYGTVWDDPSRKVSRDTALNAAFGEMRAIQSGLRGDPTTVIGPRPGASTIVHRVPLNDLDWPAMTKAADYRCTYCGEQFPHSQLHREHDVPLARGGANHRSNIVVSCGPCNLEKGTLTGDEYRQRRAVAAARGDTGVNGRKRSTASGSPRSSTRYPGRCVCGGTFSLRNARSGRYYRCGGCGMSKPLKKDV